MSDLRHEANKLRDERELKELRAAILALSDKDWQKRLRSITALGSMRRSDEMSSEALPALVLSTEDENKFVAQSAISALGEIAIGLKLVVDKLLNHLNSSDSEIRRLAAFSLGKIGPESARGIPKLLEMLDEEDTVSEASCWALGVVGDEAIGPLSEATRNTKPRIRAGSCTALGVIGPRAIGALPELVQCLKDSESQVRLASAKALGQLRAAKQSEMAVEDLIAVLSDPEPEVRWAAAEALRKIGTEEATKAWLNSQTASSTTDLIKLLVHEDRSARVDAAQKLAKNIQHGEAVDWQILSKALKDIDAQVRASTAEAVGVLGDRTAVRALIACCADPEAKVRAAVAASLGKAREEQEAGVVELVKMLKDKDRAVRLAAAVSLENLPGESAVKALESFDWE